MTVKVERLYMFRAPGGRMEHVTRDRIYTLCGEDARYGARYTHADNRADTVVRPMCKWCRAAI
jgi:hypothetical protein